MPISDRALASDIDNSFIARFVARFSPAGMPSERTMVRLYIRQYQQTNGVLPSGRQRLEVRYHDETVLGRSVDFTALSVAASQQQTEGSLKIR